MQVLTILPITEMKTIIVMNISSLMYIHIFLHVCTYIYIQTCVCVCVYLCMLTNSFVPPPFSYYSI